jgi:predicted nucleotidyltransferase
MIMGRSVDVAVADAIKNPYFRASIEQTRKRLYAA